MSFYVSARKGEALLDSERLGGNGVHEPIRCLLFAGYGLGKFPHSKRVRGWIRAMYDGGSPGNTPRAFNETRTKRDLRKLVAFGEEGNCWIEFEADKDHFRTMDRGVKIKQITCPILQGLLIFDRKCNGDPNEDWRLSGEELVTVTTAVQAVLPELEESPLFDRTLYRMLAIMEKAVEREGRFSFG